MWETIKSHNQGRSTFINHASQDLNQTRLDIGAKKRRINDNTDLYQYMTDNDLIMSAEPHSKDKEEEEKEYNKWYTIYTLI